MVLFLHLASHVKTGTVSTASTIHMHTASMRGAQRPSLAPGLQMHVATFKELAGRLTAAGPLINVNKDSNEHYMVSLSLPSCAISVGTWTERTSGRPRKMSEFAALLILIGAHRSRKWHHHPSAKWHIHARCPLSTKLAKTRLIQPQSPLSTSPLGTVSSLSKAPETRQTTRS